MITTSSFQILLSFPASRKLQRRLIVSSEKLATINIQELEVFEKRFLNAKIIIQVLMRKAKKTQQADQLIGLLFPADLF